VWTDMAHFSWCWWLVEVVDCTERDIAWPYETNGRVSVETRKFREGYQLGT